uniref:Uncharacterized protein n=1 Tax=Spumella elongata TaxID=89044 RepID=A0A7S3M3D7_9STRA|mmetsp:Transcript_23882/g.41283  ORF Transcript_23882/g.41283 Transcript_23882/m.41283 type:complete len:460 (+) Transcript_23882:78-1457(+)
MVDYYKLLESKNDFMQKFWTTLKIAEENSGIDNSAALSIQRVYRGTTSRERIAKKSYKANEIQRVFRGLLGRNIARNKLKELDESRQLSLFNYLCIQLQKCFRGYYSRKYKHDQHRRKEYCKMLEEQGEQVRQNLQKYAEDLAEREEAEKEQKKDEEFTRLAQNLHHLVSTKRIPGIYKPLPYYNNAPTMKAMPIEEHVRGVVKDLLRTRGIAHTGMVTDLNGTKKIPLKGLKYRLSVQASAPYDAVEQDNKRKAMLHKIITADKGSFAAGGKTNLINQPTVPLSVGNPYMDPWANPMLVKGVPKDQKQLEESNRTFKPLFTAPFTALTQPFLPRAGGNKSTVLANDVFDTIAEAEETGGAIQRFRGTTGRFGLSTNMDNRTDGTIPKPPIRTSVIKTSTKTTLHKMTLKLKNTSAPATGMPINNRSRSHETDPQSHHNDDDDSSDEEQQQDYEGSGVY